MCSPDAQFLSLLPQELEKLMLKCLKDDSIQNQNLEVFLYDLYYHPPVYDSLPSLPSLKSILDSTSLSPVSSSCQIRVNENEFYSLPPAPAPVPVPVPVPVSVSVPPPLAPHLFSSLSPLTPPSLPSSSTSSSTSPSWLIVSQPTSQISDKGEEESPTKSEPTSNVSPQKRTIIKRKKWSEADMKMAIDLVQNQGFSGRAAAMNCNVPRSTLSDRMTGRFIREAKKKKLTEQRDN
jgi:hypothetical protein